MKKSLDDAFRKSYAEDHQVLFDSPAYTRLKELLDARVEEMVKTILAAQGMEYTSVDHGYVTGKLAVGTAMSISSEIFRKFLVEDVRFHNKTVNRKLKLFKKLASQEFRNLNRLWKEGKNG